MVSTEPQRPVTIPPATLIPVGLSGANGITSTGRSFAGIVGTSPSTSQRSAGSPSHTGGNFGNGGRVRQGIRNRQQNLPRSRSNRGRVCLRKEHRKEVPKVRQLGHETVGDLCDEVLQ